MIENLDLNLKNNLEENRKGIILAGGIGKRLMPLTKSINKHLIPIYDKPMIYYPLSTLMLAGIKNILIITTKKDQERYIDLIGNGEDFGINIQYKIEEEPLGITHSFIISEDFIGEDPITLILGDNFFHGSEFIEKLKNSYVSKGAKVFIYPVKDPSSYGVIQTDKSGGIIGIEEKPKFPKSKNVITGIYFFDNNVVENAKKCTFSARGELEIIDLLKIYLNKKELNIEFLGRGTAWLDTGSWENLLEASNFVRSIENRQGYKIGCPEEISLRNGWISKSDVIKLTSKYKENDYKKYLLQIIKESNH